MQRKNLVEAMKEAQRFLAKAEAVLSKYPDQELPYFGSAETGAVRRASLDLTRALATMRRP